MKRQPVYAHNKAWQRLDDSLIELTDSRRNAILDEQDEVEKDWSSQIIHDATIDDLDPRAVAKAREKFIELHPERETEIKAWDDATFLNKAKLTIKGQITNSTIILLGREESEHFLSPAVCKIRWMRKKNGTDENEEFGIFSIPMILAVDEVAGKIKNATYTYTIEGNMFPDTLLRYDVFTIREPLCNAIAHQDYSLSARIEVVEYEDERLRFKNYGIFLPLSVESVVENDFPESRYRNKFLVEAMRNVKMVETEGGGIRKLYMQQKKRFFPMPKYDLGGQTVICEIEGRVLDENFAKILVNNPNLTLADIILLDKVQKHEHISEDSLTYLRRKKYVEGRKPNIYLAFSVVKQSKHVGLKTSYIKNKSFDDDYFKKLIIDYITNFGKATRQELTALLENKLPETLSKQQKFDKVTNLLSSLKKKGIIKVIDRKYWVMAKSD
jgi:ATP-dependent DNA helicase RecG